MHFTTNIGPPGQSFRIILGIALIALALTGGIFSPWCGDYDQ
jgi:hypothetical protein